MRILMFLSENWDSALIIAAIFALGIFSSAKKWREVLRSILFGLVTWAEREYGSGTGALKLAAVIEKFYPHIPFLLRAFFSVKDIEASINLVLKEAKLKWEKNPKLIGDGEGG